MLLLLTHGAVGFRRIGDATVPEWEPDGMQAIWKGSITWGLVSVPVTLYSANQDRRSKLSLHQFHEPDGARIRYRKVCEAEDAEVPAEEIVKGVEVDKKTIILDKQELDDLPLASKSTVEVVEFVPTAQVDALAVHDTYYLAPQKPTKPYALLAQSLDDADVVAIAKVAIRDRERLSMVRARDGVLLLHTLYWPDEIKEPEFSIPSGDRISKQEKRMASQLITSMTVPEPEWTEFRDEYADALEDLIATKAKGEGITPSAPSRGGGKVVSLVEALEKSIKSGKKSPARKTTKKATKKATKKSTAKKKSA